MKSESTNIEEKKMRFLLFFTRLGKFHKLNPRFRRSSMKTKKNPLCASPIKQTENLSFTQFFYRLTRENIRRWNIIHEKQPKFENCVVNRRKENCKIAEVQINNKKKRKEGKNLDE